MNNCDIGIIFAKYFQDEATSGRVLFTSTTYNYFLKLLNSVQSGVLAHFPYFWIQGPSPMLTSRVHLEHRYPM